MGELTGLNSYNLLIIPVLWIDKKNNGRPGWILFWPYFNRTIYVFDSVNKKFLKSEAFLIELLISEHSKVKERKW